MRNIKRCSGALAVVTAMLVSPLVSAQQDMGEFIETPEGPNNLVGLGVLAVPDYYGSSQHKGAAAPIVRYHFAGNRYVQLLGPELSVNLIDRKDWRAGALLRYRARRDDDVDDAVVKRMRPIPGATELGAYAAYHMPLDSSNPMHKVVFYGDVVGNMNSVYNGATGNVRVSYYYPFPQTWTSRPTVGQIGLGLFFASESFNRKYFGVTGSDLALFPSRGGLPFLPDGGMTSVKIPFSVTTQLDKQWLLTAGARYERLLGDAKDSPVVDQRGDANQWAGGVAVSYLF